MRGFALYIRNVVSSPVCGRSSVATQQCTTTPAPTPSPSLAPTPAPTLAPTPQPTRGPLLPPTPSPTASPTKASTMVVLLEARLAAAVEGVDLVFELRSGSSGIYRNRDPAKRSLRTKALSSLTFWPCCENFRLLDRDLSRQHGHGGAVCVNTFAEFGACIPNANAFWGSTPCTLSRVTPRLYLVDAMIFRANDTAFGPRAISKPSENSRIIQVCQYLECD